MLPGIASTWPSQASSMSSSALSMTRIPSVAWRMHFLA